MYQNPLLASLASACHSQFKTEVAGLTHSEK